MSSEMRKRHIRKKETNGRESKRLRSALERLKKIEGQYIETDVEVDQWQNLREFTAM